MFWPAFVFNLCVGLLLAAYLLRGVRRFERRADAVMAKLDQWYAEELRKFDVARDEIRASMRAQVDAAIVEMQARFGTPAVTVSRAGFSSGFGSAFAKAAPPEPQNATLPSEEEIRELPRWARVAFAARCASRVLPLFRLSWPEAPEEYSRSVAHAVQLASDAAASANVTTSGARDVAKGAVIAAVVARSTPVGAAVARSAARAVDAATESDAIAYPYSDGGRVREACDASVEAMNHVRGIITFASNASGSVEQILGDQAAGIIFDNNIVVAGGTVIVPLNPEAIIRKDFKHLLSLSQAGNWTDETPVMPSIFGPLWPIGRPNSWPKSRTELVFKFDVPDDMTTADAIELAKELSAALCALDLAGGGHGLVVQPPVEITAPVRTGCRIS